MTTEENEQLRNLSNSMLKKLLKRTHHHLKRLALSRELARRKKAKTPWKTGKDQQ